MKYKRKYSIIEIRKKQLTAANPGVEVINGESDVLNLAYFEMSRIMSSS